MTAQAGGSRIAAVEPSILDAGALRARWSARLWSAFYSLGLTLVVWLGLVPFELARIAIGRARWSDLSEYLGRAKPHDPHRPRIAVHAVSVGEMAATVALLRELVGVRPDWRFIITTGTREGRALAAIARETIPAIDAILWLPWDRLRPIRRWMSRLEIVAMIVLETEIWPNLYLACHTRGVPLLLVNGRLAMSEARRYELARGLFGRVLACASWIGAQSDLVREAFIRAGAPAHRVHVTGSLKTDAAIAEARPIPEPWTGWLASARPLVVAGSTHPPEDDWMLSAIIRLRTRFEGLRVVVAPRHPVRTRRRIETLAEARGLKVARWSRPSGDPAGWDVVLLDEIGWLPAVYRFADVAFVGGSLAPRGGHNPWEAAGHARAIVVGPYTGNFADAVHQLAARNAIVRLGRGDAVDELEAAIGLLLADNGRREDLGLRAQACLEEQRGAARRSAAAVVDCLAEVS
jgi:3-deoxy-D-manno-octulosonic-acid transferase